MTTRRMLRTSERLRLLNAFRQDGDEQKGLRYLEEDLECLLAQVREGRLSVGRVANYLCDLAAELRCPGAPIIHAADPPVPLSRKDLPLPPSPSSGETRA